MRCLEVLMLTLLLGAICQSSQWNETDFVRVNGELSLLEKGTVQTRAYDGIQEHLSI